MFDISFAELMIVAVVGLLVIGPEKLPKIARTLGAYTGRLQRYVAQVKDEVNREMRFEELQALQDEIQSGADKVKSSILDGKQQVEDELGSLEASVKPKRKAPAKKTTAKKAVSKKPTAKRSAARKTTTKKTTTKKAKPESAASEQVS